MTAYISNLNILVIWKQFAWNQWLSLSPNFFKTEALQALHHVPPLQLPQASATTVKNEIERKVY